MESTVEGSMRLCVCGCVCVCVCVCVRQVTMNGNMFRHDLMFRQYESLSSTPTRSSFYVEQLCSLSAIDSISSSLYRCSAQGSSLSSCFSLLQGPLIWETDSYKGASFFKIYINVVFVDLEASQFVIWMLLKIYCIFWGSWKSSLKHLNQCFFLTVLEIVLTNLYMNPFAVLIAGHILSWPVCLTSSPQIASSPILSVQVIQSPLIPLRFPRPGVPYPLISSFPSILLRPSS